MPWLRSRGLTAQGNIIFTAAAYHPSNLLYKYEAFGGIPAFDALWKPKTLLPDINWGSYPPLVAAHAAWQLMLNWDIHKSFFPTPELDQAAKILADVFALDAMPFRLPMLHEKLQECELSN